MPRRCASRAESDQVEPFFFPSSPRPSTGSGAGTQGKRRWLQPWIPAFAGMTRLEEADSIRSKSALVKVERVVQVETGEDGEDIGLQHGHQQLQQDQRDGDGERQEAENAEAHHEA